MIELPLCAVGMIRKGRRPPRNTQNLDIKGMPLVEVGGLGLASQRPIISASLGTVYTMARRYDEAIAQERETVEMHPDFYCAPRFLGLALELKVATGEAIAEYRKAFELYDDPVVLALLAHAEVTIGKQNEARQILAQLTEEATTRYVPAYAFAVI